MKSASNLMALSKFVSWYFKFLSSADVKKSIKTPGATNPYGVPIN